MFPVCYKAWTPWPTMSRHWDRYATGTGDLPLWLREGSDSPAPNSTDVTPAMSSTWRSAWWLLIAIFQLFLLFMSCAVYLIPTYYLSSVFFLLLFSLSRLYRSVFFTTQRLWNISIIWPPNLSTWDLSITLSWCTLSTHTCQVKMELKCILWWKCGTVKMEENHVLTG